MFLGAGAFNGNLSRWNVSSVTNMRSMFNGAKAFNSDISGWDVSLVTGMGGMFNDASIFNQDLCAWGEKFPYDSDDVCSSNRIFSNSGCTFQEPPQISQRQRGPFCAADCRRFKCFSHGDELKAVIDLYMNDDGCTSG